MTHNHPARDEVAPVVQADRDLAAEIYRRFRYGDTVEIQAKIRREIERGNRDNDPIVQLIASRNLSALSVPDARVQPGWKLVPVEPTEAMRDAGQSQSDFWDSVWSAMLSAIPDATPGNEYEIDPVATEAHSRGMDEGATFVLESLARQLGVTDYQQADGSEEWEGDVSGTVHNILIAASVVDDYTGRIAHLGDATTSAPTAENLREPIPYTHAIGEAGQTYINSVSLNGDRVLGGNFYYANLWDAMQRAALAGGWGITSDPMQRARDMLAAEWAEAGFGEDAIGLLGGAEPGEQARLALRAIANALQSADKVRAEGWRPIETAPRDGEPVLIWTPETHTYVTMGRYWIQDEAWADEEGEQAFPTHWRPLPPAPEMGR